MQEFSSISVSTYEPDSLVAKLADEAAAGWSVVAIVPTGSTVTAYLSRESTGATTDSAGAATPATESTTPESASPWTPGAADDAAAAAAVAPVAATQPVTPEPAPEPAVVAPAAEPAAASTSNAPAGWYADPSGRYDLRYWDGTTWTEHVSRAGQQYTDPPVA